MRLIEFKDLKEGMTTAQGFYGINGERLIREGVVLSSKLIEKLATYGIPHIYVSDNFSDDIVVQCTVSSEVKSAATISIKKLYQAIQNKNPSLHEFMQPCLDAIDKITEDVLSEKIDLYDIFDIKLKDTYQYQHPVNVTIISLIIGRTLNLSSLDLYKLGVGAFFHDVGQMFIPKEVFEKEGIYSPEDHQIMRKHTEDGYRFAKDQFYLPMKSYLAILQHHERYDGTGYPHQKAGKDISEYGRIVAIADTYDALLSQKPYREASSPAQAFKIIIQESGKAFDPDFIRIFASRVSPYPVGYTLKLDQQRTGIVIKNYLGKPFNPTIRIIEENGIPLEEPYIMNL